jgi:hypothetical protein
MIVYDLVCGLQHRFEGWFGSAEDFERQRRASLVRCPLCDDAAIERLPSANIQVGRAPAPVQSTQELPKAAEAHQEITVAGGGAETLRRLRQLVAETENVGRAFPEEARKIHYEEAPKRGIRGQATLEEADTLRDEGIEFMSLPSLFTSDLN